MKTEETLMTAYRRGARLEYLARDVLRQQGYVVARSAGSHGPFDLIAVSAQRVLLVQVKQKGQSIRLALEHLAAVRAPRGVRKQVWVYYHGQWRVIDATGDTQWKRQLRRSFPAKPSSK
jgi:Holliday junction resolvase